MLMSNCNRNLVPRAIFKKCSLFRLPLIAKKRTFFKIALGTRLRLQSVKVQLHKFKSSASITILVLMLKLFNNHDNFNLFPPNVSF